MRTGIANGKERDGPPRVLNHVLSVFALLAGLCFRSVRAIPVLAAAAIVPTALVASMIPLLDVHPRNLRKVGWTLAATDVITLLLLLAGFA